MKKKFVMRVASFALCVVFTGMLFGAPKSKAVVTETAIGTAAVASYFQATGLTMAASAGSTGALITTGVADIAGSYAMATGAASSGSAFLSSVAAGVSISPAGALVLTAAAVVAIGALVAWYVGENGLESVGDTAVAVPGTSDFYLYGTAELPSIDTVWNNKESFPFVAIVKPHNATRYSLCMFTSGLRPLSDQYGNIDAIGSGSCVIYSPSSSAWVYTETRPVSSSFTIQSLTQKLVWISSDVLDKSTGELFFSSIAPVPVGDVQDQLEVTRSPEFIQPDVDFTAESQKQMVIDLGLGAGTTLDTVAEEVPNLIAAGELSPTYEIQSTAPEVDDDLPYIPILSEILQGVQSIAGTVVDGILNGLEGLFVPSETYLEALPAQITDTFENRTGFLTYPFSLLPEFVDRLSDTSSDWILSWPQIVEPFTNTVLFQRGSFNVSSFIRSDAELKMLYELYQLIAKVLMSFGFLGLCYNKYCSVIGDRYGGP